MPKIESFRLAHTDEVCVDPVEATNRLQFLQDVCFRKEGFMLSPEERTKFLLHCTRCLSCFTSLSNLASVAQAIRENAKAKE